MEIDSIDLRQNLYRGSDASILASRHKCLRLLFLDVDGVLNCQEQRNTRLLPPKLQLIGKIVRKAQAQIVLSSSWRELPEMRHELLDALMQVEGITNEHIIGQTQSSVSVGLPRATEVRAFVQQPLISRTLVSWAVVDDRDLLAETKDSDRAAWRMLRGRFVRTDDEVGLREEDAEELVQILSQEPPAGNWAQCVVS